MIAVARKALPAFLCQILIQGRNPRFGLGVNPHHRQADKTARLLHQPLHAYQRSGGADAVDLLGVRHYLTPVMNRFTNLAQLPLGHNPEQALLQLALKAVHRRQHQNKHGDPEGDTCGGGKRDKTDKAAALAGTVKAPADDQGQQGGMRRHWPASGADKRPSTICSCLSILAAS